MYIVTTDEMNRIDQASINTWEIPSIILMENAGRLVSDYILNEIRENNYQKVVIVAGVGNNGGDSLVVARHLLQAGISVVVFIIKEGHRPSKDYEVNYSILQHLPIRMFQISDVKHLKSLKAHLNLTDIIIDGLLGTGFKAPLSNLFKEVIRLINARTVPTIAIDVPSGISGNDGVVDSTAVAADVTLTLGWPKIGLYMPNVKQYSGIIDCLDIGIPIDVVHAVAPNKKLIDCSVLKEKVKDRVASSHKGNFGHLGILAGSLGMSGACVLAIKGAFRSGVGVVRSYVDEDIHLIVANSVPEAMIKPINWNNDFSLYLNDLMEKSNALLVGPGIGMNDPKKECIKYIIYNTKIPVIFDADALSVISNQIEWLNESKGRFILTPHPGEMALLLNTSIEDIQSHRIDYARTFAVKYQIYLVLKGSHTVIASPDGEVFINKIDSIALATSGTGDILAGMIGSFVSQGYCILDALILAVGLHGKAGVFVEESIGVIASIASDVVDAIPTALNSLKE